MGNEMGKMLVIYKKPADPWAFDKHYFDVHVTKPRPTTHVVISRLEKPPVVNSHCIMRLPHRNAIVRLNNMSGTSTSDAIGKSPDRRKLIAVVYADMVGYSRLIGLDDAG